MKWLPRFDGRTRRIGLALLCLPILLLVQDTWRMDWDSAIYIGTAESLVDGEGLRYQGYEISKYPPGVALLLAPVVACFGRDPLALRGLMVACAILSVFLVDGLARRRLPPGLAFLIAGGWALSLALWQTSLVVASELPALCAILASLTVGSRWLQAPTWRTTGLLLALCILAILLRTTSFVLLGALLLTAFLQLKTSGLHALRPHLAVLFVATLSLSLLFINRDGFVAHPMPAVLPETACYEHQLLAEAPRDPESPPLTAGGFLRRIDESSRFYGQRWALFNLGHTLQSQPFAWAALGLTSLLLVAFLAWCQRSCTAWFVLGSLFVLAIWPFQYDRFLTLLAPLIWICMGHGLHRILPASPRVRAAVYALLAVGFLFGQLPHLNRTVQREAQGEAGLSPHSQNYHRAFAVARDTLPQNAVLLCESGPQTWFLTQRRAFSIPLLPDPAEFDSFLMEFGVTHILVLDGWRTTATLPPWRAAYPERSEVIVDESPAFKILRVVPR